MYRSVEEAVKFESVVFPHMHRNGDDTRYVQELLGHHDIKSSQSYTHVTISDLNAVYDRTHPAAKNSIKLTACQLPSIVDKQSTKDKP